MPAPSRHTLPREVCPRHTLRPSLPSGSPQGPLQQRLAREVGEHPGRVTTFASLTMTFFQNRGSPQEGLDAKCRTGPSLCLAPVAVFLLHLSSQCENFKSNPKLLPSDQHLGEKPESLLAINIPRSKTPDVRAGRAAARGRPGGSSLLSPESGAAKDQAELGKRGACGKPGQQQPRHDMRASG